MRRERWGEGRDRWRKEEDVGEGRDVVNGGNSLLHLNHLDDGDMCR